MFRAGFEWFWRAQALREARAANSSEANRIACERARIAAEVAEQVLASGPWLAGRGHHLVAALYVESIGWGLRALDAMRSDFGAATAFAGSPQSHELERLLERHAASVLEGSSSSRELDRLRVHAVAREFENPTRHPQETEQAALLLSRVARRLLRCLTPAQDAVDRLLLQRLLRCLGLALGVALAVWSAAAAREHLARRADLSAGKPWVASSEYGDVCRSPERRCAALKSYFFHTRSEKEPWLELDLLSEQQFSRVQVINRKDCCTERATPLVIEVSSDRSHWREVMRKNEDFERWQARFAPVRARWVRLRVARRSFLHLADVRISK